MSDQYVEEFRAFYIEYDKNHMPEDRDRIALEKFREYDWSIFSEKNWKELVSFCPHIHMIMPEDQKTKGIALSILLRICNGDQIKSIPDKFFDKELITHIIDHCKIDVVYLPLQYIATTVHFQFMYKKIREICAYILLNGSGYSHGWYETIFRTCTDKYKDKEFCEEAIDIFPGLFKYFPKEHLTFEMIMKASLVKNQYETSLHDVPSEFKNCMICMNFYNTNPWEIAHFPKKYIDKYLIDNALTKNVEIIGVIPREFLTQDLCTRTFEKAFERGYASYKIIETIPSEFRTREMCLKSIKHWYFPCSSIHLKFIPDEYKDDEFWMSLQQYCDISNYVPKYITKLSNKY